MKTITKKLLSLIFIEQDVKSKAVAASAAPAASYQLANGRLVG